MRGNFRGAIVNPKRKRVRTEKDKKRQKEYYEKNKVVLKEKMNVYYLNNRDGFLERRREYREKNRIALNKELRDYHSRNKATCLTFYSPDEIPKCSADGCPVTDIDMLTIDHINNDGADHRRGIHGGNKAGHGTYRWLIKNDFPPGFQVLCFNHNFKKAIEYKRSENAN
jgi:hypothetical protein